MKQYTVVTGASSGIGKEFAYQLAQRAELEEIWIVGRRKENLLEIQNELGSKIRVFAIDLTNKTETETLLSAMKAKKDEGFVLSYFVNNAGFGSYGTFLDNEIDWSLSMIDLNVSVLTKLSYAAVKLMSPGSVLLNVASLAAFQPLGNFAVYGATKAYVLSFSLGLAAETEELGIRVSVLCPGPVETEFAQVASRGARVHVLHGKTTQTVVAHCLKRATKKRIVVHGFDWKFQSVLGRFLPRFTIARLTYKFMKRPLNKD